MERKQTFIERNRYQHYIKIKIKGDGESRQRAEKHRDIYMYTTQPCKRRKGH